MIKSTYVRNFIFTFDFMGLKELQELRENRDKPKEKKVYRIPKKSAKKIAKEAEEKKASSVEGKEETLNEWFQKIEDRHWGKQDLDIDGFDHEENDVELPACMECGVKISRLLARHATAHLLPKKLFKSVSTNDLNYLILGAGCGCHDKTHSLKTFVQMKIWPQAAKQINQLLPLLSYDELKFVSQQLYDALENY